MKIELVKKANDILAEIESLKKYKDFLSHKNQSETVHFEIHQHYGRDSAEIIIDKKHNKRLLKIVDEIISELETELSNL